MYYIREVEVYDLVVEVLARFQAVEVHVCQLQVESGPTWFVYEHSVRWGRGRGEGRAGEGRGGRGGERGGGG